MPRTKGILLYSGGLDSLLAAKLLMEQDIELTGLHCILPFYPAEMNPDELESSVSAKEIGLKLVYYRCGKEYIEMVKNPPHGYGKNINPCIDCKIFFMKRAAELMTELKADFVATGEVVGQRPMSQLKHTLIHIEKNTGIKGRLLRPLSAKILEPTIPELEGKVDRNRLLDISGRGRKRQMELAAHYGIKNYSHPAGGCLFTDSFFASRVRDLFKNCNYCNTNDFYLLKIGRHFRLNDNLKIIVSRNEAETMELEKLHGESDCFFRPEFKGPSVFARGRIASEDIKTINSIIARYGKCSPEENSITLTYKSDKTEKSASPEPIDDSRLNLMRI